MLSFFFCGVLAKADSMPRFWIFLYRCTPLTYWVSSVLSTGLANNKVECATNEWVPVSLPANETCGGYMGEYISSRGGYVLDADSTASCSYCSMSDTNVFLQTIGSSYSNRWRDFGLGWVYIVFNVGAALALYYLVRMPKAKKTL
jgi:ABC-type multidrug transport system permease subunit